MQTATLIVSCLSLVVSTTTLVVFVVAIKKTQKSFKESEHILKTKADAFKRALEEI